MEKAQVLIVEDEPLLHFFIIGALIFVVF